MEKAIVHNKGERVFEIDGVKIEAGQTASINADKVEKIAKVYARELEITFAKPEPKVEVKAKKDKKNK
tara:strand:+ start:2208 stop:2411 length:204 start_codon:yes stop_codon:yes gene_type:complete